jgi:hypothetical protein
MLGGAAEGASIRLDGGIVIPDFGEIPEDRLLEAGRLRERATISELPAGFPDGGNFSCVDCRGS